MSEKSEGSDETLGSSFISQDSFEEDAVGEQNMKKSKSGKKFNVTKGLNSIVKVSKSLVAKSKDNATPLY